MDGRAIPLVDRKVAGGLFLELCFLVFAVVTSPTTAERSVACCSAVVAVVWCGGSCSVNCGCGFNVVEIEGLVVKLVDALYLKL